MKALRHILFPVALVYRCITSIRNFCYDKVIFKSSIYQQKIIVVGNLNTGGTGKTPMVIHLLSLFNFHETAILSRGYGRKTSGFKEVKSGGKSIDFGDESLMIKQQFPSYSIYVCESRVKGIENIIASNNKIRNFILDDAFQHRSVKASFNILLTSYDQPFFDDFILPQGNLREAKKGASRANVIVVTKCPPNLSQNLRLQFIRKIRKYSDAPVFFASINYSEPIFQNGNYEGGKPESVLVVTGIANAKPLVDHAKKQYKTVEHLSFNDHYHYSEEDFKKILEKMNSFGDEKKAILTTEKDAVKWFENGSPAYQLLKKFTLMIQPVKVNIENEIAFNELVKTNA